MDFKCKNCTNRWTWDCEDYHWGYFDKERCESNFELDIDTLEDEEKDMILELARLVGISRGIKNVYEK